MLVSLKSVSSYFTSQLYPYYFFICSIDCFLKVFIFKLNHMDAVNEKKCAYCGQAIDDFDVFCKQCGKSQQ